MNTSNLSTKDLMVGDWLQHANGKYYQVTRIDRLGDGNIHFACGFPHAWEYNNKFNPIPLTTEILEQNGFIYEPNSEEKDDGWWNWKAIGVSTGNEYVNIAFRGDNVAVYDLEIMKGFNSGTLHLDFIHQLQHALKLCGIEKEIEL